MKHFDTLALGTCYVDTNLSDYPFGETGIPVDTELVGGQYEIVAGGSAVNFCRLLSDLGLKTAFMGMAGRDPNGDSLEEALRMGGIEPCIIREDGLLTNISFNMTNPDGEHIMLVAGTANAALAPEAVLAQLGDKLGDAKMLYMGGCFKLKTLAPAFTDIAHIAKQNDTAVVVDHGRIPQSVSSDMTEHVKTLVLRSDYYLPSRDEFCQLWEAGSIEAGLARLHVEAPELTVVVKDGANGAYYWNNGETRHIIAPKVDRVINATGAGDSFNAGVMTAVARGLSIAEAVEYGCLVGATKVAGSVLPKL